jgi:predicted Zn finger-like uncharacterized protein
MDVQCERCKTEYEFDDALVSGRGTTVRCTNCGHQFKVRKSEASEPGTDADRWQVRTQGGQDLTFLTLRELQRAILAKQVGRADVLRRGQASPRALGTIAELEPFFEGRASSRPPPPGAAGQVARMPAQSAVPRIASEPPPPAFPKRTAAWGSAPEPAPPVPPPRRKIDTLRPPGVAAAPPPPAPMTPAPPPASAVPVPLVQQVPHTPIMQREVQPQPAVNATPYAFGQGSQAHIADDPVTQRRPAPAPAPPPMVEMSSPLPPPTVPVRQRASYPDDDLPDGRRPSMRYADDYAVPSRRRAVGGWIVALVLMMAVGVVGWVVAKPYFTPRPAAATASLDPRAQGFVNDGERAMTDGNLDAAQQAFDKASALAEHDPRVLVDEARVAAAKADVPWLKSRLLPPDAKDDIRATKSDLADQVARARAAADAALAAAPDDPGAVRAHVDALRLSGDRDLARRDVSRIISQASQPETAYVLAALDLAEPEPLWTALIDRLRLAASSEGNAGRARAALVYALAQSGDVASAKSELAKLDAASRPYPLLPSLHAFVDRTPTKATADGGVAANVPTVALSSLPTQPTAGAGAGAGPVAANDPDDAPVPGATGSAMKAAQAAIRKGDWDRARTIYEALVSRNPGDSEALSGLGDVARAQGDTSGALAAYRRALSVNPSYLPSLLGVADTQWASGDHGGALKGYKDIVDRFPEGTYPPYVKTRVDAATAAPTATTIVVAPTVSALPANTSPPTPKPAPSNGL